MNRPESDHDTSLSDWSREEIATDAAGKVFDGLLALASLLLVIYGCVTAVIGVGVLRAPNPPLLVGIGLVLLGVSWVVLAGLLVRYHTQFRAAFQRYAVSRVVDD